MKYPSLFFLLMASLVSSSHGIITFGGDNSANTTDPGTGVQWDSIATITNSNVTSFKGSAIHLGNGYMMTANHNFNYSTVSHVSFNGVDVFERDATFTPQQVAPGVDMTIFKLTATPTTSTVNRSTLPIATTDPATMVAYGNGRLPSELTGTDEVTWGDSSTAAKRWGINEPVSNELLSYTESGDPYSEVVIKTYLGSSATGLGDDEGAVVRWDSGSGLFQDIGGTWYLIGMAVGTTQRTLGASTFGNDNNGNLADSNYFVDISTYNAAIDAIIPEPSATLIAIPGLSLLLMAFSRRRKKKNAH